MLLGILNFILDTNQAQVIVNQLPNAVRAESADLFGQRPAVLLQTDDL